MSALTVAQMREADRRAIEDLGIPSVVLMENAGRAVFREIKPGSVGIVCGKGNNGGDGFVIARLCLLSGMKTQVILVGSPDDLTPDSTSFMMVYEKLGGKIVTVSAEDELTDAVHNLIECDTLIDALLGTGIQGEVRGLTRSLIDVWPDIETISVDIPSGLNADTGQPCGCCVRASKTVTFQFLKQGFENPDAKGYLGEVVIADIGIPGICGDDVAWGKFCHSK